MTQTTGAPTRSGFDASAAARFIDVAHRERRVYENLPAAIAPRTFDDAYAAQEALYGLWGPRLGGLAGLKIATTTKIMQELMGIDRPCGGMIYRDRVLTSPARIKKSDHVNVVVECELAVRLACDLPGRGEAYTRADVRAAVGEVMAAFELIEDRKAHYKSCDALSLIADNAWNAGIVIGAGQVVAKELELDGRAGRLVISPGGEVRSGLTDDPMGALAWVANLAVERGRPLKAGQVVITGSVIVTLPIAVGQTFRFEIDGIGAVEMTAEA